MSLIVRLLTVMILVLAANPASAATNECVVTPSVTMNLGAQSSYTVIGGGVQPVSGLAGLSCPGAMVSLLSTDYARATASSARGFKLGNATGNTVAYRLSADSNGTYTFTQGSTINYMNRQLLTLLGSSSSDYNAPLYLTLTGTANLAAGTYTDTVTLAWDWSICRGIGAGGLCSQRETGTGTTTVLITMVVTQDCRMTTPSINFGSAPLASRFGTATQFVTVACTKGTSYAISFTAGGAGNARPWRKMTDGAGHSLRYNIFRPDGVTIWDEGNPLAIPTPGTGALSPDQAQSYVAKIDADQPTPPAGSYTDMISAVVTF